MLTTQTLFDQDCDLQYYIRLSMNMAKVTSILYPTLVAETHYILIEHCYDSNEIICHNSMVKLAPRTKDLYGNFDVTQQRVLTAFLGKVWTFERVLNYTDFSTSN